MKKVILSLVLVSAFAVSFTSCKEKEAEVEEVVEEVVEEPVVEEAAPVVDSAAVDSTAAPAQ